MFEQDRAAMGDDWHYLQTEWGVVGERMAAAMQEVAQAVSANDADFVVYVMQAAACDPDFPSPAAVLILDEASPGAGELVFDRFQAITERAHRQRKHGIRSLGRSLLDGMTNSNLPGGISGQRRKPHR
jgi:hypothetical protein